MTNNSTAAEKNWPEAREYRKSIRLQFSLFVSGMILVLMVVTGFVITGQYVKNVTENVVEKLLVLARSYSGPAGKLIISADEPDALLLSNICNKLSADNPDVYWVGITGQNDVFLAHTDIKQVIAGARMYSVEGTSFGDMLRPGESFDLTLDTLRLVVPIEENGIIVGRLIIGASNREIIEARNASIMTVASITVFMIILGIPLTLALMHRMLKPVKIITDRLKIINLDDFSLDIPIQSGNEFGYLAETLRVMGSKLNRAQRDLLEKERIARELEIAREIQANILPRACPEFPQLEFAVDYRSAREVGGDYYDFIELDGERLAFLVADVSGKSLPGMLVMLLTRDIIRKQVRTTPEPDELLKRTNLELLDNIKSGMFVTMFVGVINRRTGVFTFASAGHNPLIRLPAAGGKAERLKIKGFPLGLFESQAFDERIERGEITLSKGDWLIQYTDGINEARNAEGNDFGMVRLLNLLVSSVNLNSHQLVENIITRHSQFVGEAPQFDDITLLAMKWHGVEADKKHMDSLTGVQVSRKEQI